MTYAAVKVFKDDTYRNCVLSKIHQWLDSDSCLQAKKERMFSVSQEAKTYVCTGIKENQRDWDTVKCSSRTHCDCKWDKYTSQGKIISWSSNVCCNLMEKQGIAWQILTDITHQWWIASWFMSETNNFIVSAVFHQNLSRRHF